METTLIGAPDPSRHARIVRPWSPASHSFHYCPRTCGRRRLRSGACVATML
jgi:hypothetical protein